MTLSQTDIEQALLAKKQFTPSTLRTYISLLNSLYRKLNGKDGVEFFSKNVKEIMEYINEKMESPQSRKTLLSALLNVTGGIEDYRKLMLENVKMVNEHYSKKQVDEKRKEKAKPYEEIRKICEQMIDAYETNKNIFNLMNVLIATLCSGYYQGTPPRRLLDYTEMKIANFNEATDNYIKGNFFHFNIYKTAKLNQSKNGTPLQRVEIPKPLRPLINKLKKEKLSDYLLLNSKGEKFTSASLNKRLTILFGFGVDMLRSIFLTDHVFADDLLKKLEENAEKMAHSLGSQLEYYVKQN